jgi:CelD/BcsL family acetyltransferase involved in cellulose biosynthesis
LELRCERLLQHADGMAMTARALRAGYRDAPAPSQRFAHTTVEWLRTFDAIAALEQPWRALEERAGDRTVLSTFDYNITWFRWYGAGDDSPAAQGAPLVGVARRGSDVVGIAPLVVRRRRIGRVPVVSIEFVPHEAYAGEFLIEDGRTEIAGSFIESLRTSVPHDVVCLNGLEPQTGLYEAVADVARQRRMAIERTAHPNAVVDLSPGYDQYFAQRTPHFRHSVRRHARLIDKAGARDIRGVLLTRGIAEIDDAVARMVAITEASHKLNGQPLAEWHRGFLAELASRFGRRGMLCLPVLTIGGRNAAFVYGLVERRTFYDITLSYDEAFAHLRPGTHLIQEMLRELAGAGVRTVVSHGAHEYKRHWASAFVPSTRVFLFARTARAAATRLLRFRLAGLWRRLGAAEP